MPCGRYVFSALLVRSSVAIMLIAELCCPSGSICGMILWGRVVQFNSASVGIEVLVQGMNPQV